MNKVAIVMGSKSDYSVVESAVITLKNFGVAADARVISAHRTPDAAHTFASEAKSGGYKVIIAAAGKAAHLGGVLAAYTTLPVIGLPIKTDMMGGLDSLLSIVQMPSGIPVATVGVNAAENAALLAVQILAVSDAELDKKLVDYKKEMAEKIAADDRDLQSK